MANENRHDESPDSGGLNPASFDETRVPSTKEIERALGLTVAKALDLNDWDEKGGLENLFTSVDTHITSAVRRENYLRTQVRNEVLGILETFPDAPEEAGVYSISDNQLRDAYRHILLRGEVTAVDGASQGHDSLVATLVTIGVSLIRYDGNLNTWKSTFFKHDYDIKNLEPLEEVRRVLNRRAQQHEDSNDLLTSDLLNSLLRRGFMAAAERKALLQKTATQWRFGHGLPIPLEILVGTTDLIDEMLPLLDQLLLQENRWVFLPSHLAGKAFTTLANALDIQEVGIFQKGKALFANMLKIAHLPLLYRDRIEEFAEEVGQKIVVGGFRATSHAPGQIFIAHAEHAISAGILALADAALQPFRGFPLLLELAGLSAKMALGVDAFRGIVESAYVKAGAANLYSDERLLNPSDVE